MSPKARERLANIRIANPTLANKVEELIIWLFSQGQIEKIDEEDLIKILEKINVRREIKIRRV